MPRLYATEHNMSATWRQRRFMVEGEEVAQGTWDLWRAREESGEQRLGWSTTPQPEPSPAPTNPNNEGSWIVSDSPSPAPQPFETPADRRARMERENPEMYNPNGPPSTILPAGYYWAWNRQNRMWNRNQNSTGLEAQANTFDEIVDREINWEPVAITRRVNTSSARSGTQAGRATDLPALRQTLKRDGNTFKKFIQKTMNTESS